jgi:hypothetical protein
MIPLQLQPKDQSAPKKSAIDFEFENKIALRSRYGRMLDYADNPPPVTCKPEIPPKTRSSSARTTQPTKIEVDSPRNISPGPCHYSTDYDYFFKTPTIARLPTLSEFPKKS